MNTKLLVLLALVVGLGIGFIFPQNPSQQDNEAGIEFSYKKLDGSNLEIPTRWSVAVATEPEFKDLDLGPSVGFYYSKISKKALLLLVQAESVCLPEEGACDGNDIEVIAIPETEMEQILQERGKTKDYSWSKTEVGGKSVDMIEYVDKETKYGEQRTVFVPREGNSGIIIEMIGYDVSNPTIYKRFLETFDPNTWGENVYQPGAS